MEKTDISEEDFRKLKSMVSEWFDQLSYTNNLKVLYTDYLSPAEVYKASKTIALLNSLTICDEFSSTNLTLLYDTINVTKHFGLVKKIKEKVPSCPVPKNVKDIEISKFTPHRLKLMKLGSILTEEDVAKIDGLYNDVLKKYADSWSLIMDLEKRCKIKEGKMDDFVKGLEDLELQTAVDALCNGTHTDAQHVAPSPNLWHQEQLNQGTYTDAQHVAPSSNLWHQKQLNQDIIIRDFLIKRQKELYQDVNRMTPAIWHKDHKVDIAEVFTELILLQSKKGDKGSEAKSTSIKKEGTPTSLPGVLSVIKSTDSCRVLITGKGGMGKTTLLRYIAYQWASDGVHNVFPSKLLFLINIRDIQSNSNILDIMEKKIDFKALILKNKLPPNSVETFLVTHADEIVFLLDGYDELQKDSKDPINLFERTEMGESTVLMSSRPDNIGKLVVCCDVHIQVKGFSPKSIKKYISNHFSSVSKVEMGCSLIKDFGLHDVDDDDEEGNDNCDIDDYDGDDYYSDDDNLAMYGGDHKEAFKLCSSPLLLLKICTIWEHKHCLPTNMSDIFKELFCCILNQYQNRGGHESSIDHFDRIPTEYVHAIQILGECMYDGLKENRLSIDKYDLSNIAKDEKLVHLALDLGFVYEDSPVHPGDLREIKTPPHKLISEALAGFYLSDKIQKCNLKADEYEVVRSNKYLHMTRVFTIGFLGADASKLLKHWLDTRAPNYFSIAQCFVHVKNDYEDHVLQKLDKHMSKEMKKLCEQMCELFRSVFNYDIDIVNGHLFKLMKTVSIEYKHYYRQIEKSAISLINTSSEESLRNSCENFVLISVVVQKMPTIHFLQYISHWREKEINILSAEMTKLDLTYSQTSIILDFEFNSSFLIHFLRNANDLSDLHLSLACNVTSMLLNVVINELYESHVKLKLRKLDINHVDLHDISRALVGKLFKVAPKLQDLNVTVVGYQVIL